MKVTSVQLHPAPTRSVRNLRAGGGVNMMQEMCHVTPKLVDDTREISHRKSERSREAGRQVPERRIG